MQTKQVKKHPLTIVISITKQMSRPKYKPKLLHNQWSVYDLNTKTTVLKERTHAECTRFIGENQKGG